MITRGEKQWVGVGGRVDPTQAWCLVLFVGEHVSNELTQWVATEVYWVGNEGDGLQEWMVRYVECL
jgi:hypothetical protein